MGIRARRIGLIILAVSAAVTTILTACRATVVAKDIVADETLTKPQKVVRVVGTYALSIGSAIVSGFAFKSYLDMDKAEIEAVSMVSEDNIDALNSYRKEISKTIGKKEETAWANANIERLANVSECPYDLNTIRYDLGEMVFYDQLQKRWYKSTNDNVLNAERNTVALIKRTGSATLNNYYSILNVKELPKQQYGEYLGWYAIPDDDDTLFEYVYSKDKNNNVFVIVLYSMIPKKGGE